MRQSVSLQTRLDWCLGDAEDWLEGKGKGEGESDEDITAVAARSEEGGTVASGVRAGLEMATTILDATEAVAGGGESGSAASGGGVHCLRRNSEYISMFGTQSAF